MKPLLYYCYDAYCGWCYGNSKVVQQIKQLYENKIDFEVLSGGMIINDVPKPISITAEYIKNAYKNVEAYTGAKFGEDYLWHIFNADKSDWFPSSEMSAIALCIFKEVYPLKQIEFATDLQYALFVEGRDLCDVEAYRHLLEKYTIDKKEFYEKLKSAKYKQKAYDEFAICKQLQVTGFPTMYLQMLDNKFYAITNGFTPFETVKERIDKILGD